MLASPYQNFITDASLKALKVFVLGPGTEKTFVTCWKRELILFCCWMVGGKYQKNGQGHGI